MRTESSGWVPADIDLTRPNVARVYDYLLGGAYNFEVDRAFADKLLEVVPEAVLAARHNRAFLGRAVRFCVEQGIRQFLDLGSGIPTVGNVHEIAQRLAPESRVVYVDNEPIAVAHSRLMLDGNDTADVVLADLVDVDEVLGSAPVRRLLDLSRPVAVIMAAVLHFVPDDANPYDAVARYVKVMASGSFLVLSHATRVDVRPSADCRRRFEQGSRMYARSSTPATGRTRDEIGAFLAGTDILEPGVVWTPLWRPDPGIHPNEHPEQAMISAALGRKP
jgi:hypothetical protein